jgi:hypothetical protein
LTHLSEPNKKGLKRSDTHYSGNLDKIDENVNDYGGDNSEDIADNDKSSTDRKIVVTVNNSTSFRSSISTSSSSSSLNNLNNNDNDKDNVQQQQHQASPDRYKPSLPKVIITASASVSDATGRKLNYSVGHVLSSGPKKISPPSYDDYKEDDVLLDPFFIDVPKLKPRQKRYVNTKMRKRRKRTTEYYVPNL